MDERPTSDTVRTTTAVEIPAEILRLRGSIDNIDAAIVHLLAERFKCTRRVGELKAEAGLPPADMRRERAQIERLGSIAQASGLDPAFAEQFREFIVGEVKRQHRSIADERDGSSTDGPDLFA
ncbi:chorismate mutase [Paraoerskovia marina]|uniref:chorismate mutase n=1 Tax=Paraoerskovia marina TaxID=545619 RepID=UPI000693553B|nr:chorismate mutase [Paraoerskovia marina]